jgi:hypothetical protein
MTDDTQQRIEQLEREKRWWKRLAIGLMTVCTGLTVVLVGIYIMAVIEVREAARQMPIPEQTLQMGAWTPVAQKIAEQMKAEPDVAKEKR